MYIITLSILIKCSTTESSSKMDTALVRRDYDAVSFQKLIEKVHIQTELCDKKIIAEERVCDKRIHSYFKKFYMKSLKELKDCIEKANVMKKECIYKPKKEKKACTDFCVGALNTWSRKNDKEWEIFQKKTEKKRNKTLEKINDFNMSCAENIRILKKDYDKKLDAEN
ncbi:uncharacterized protein VNE69_09158 [Vairimorpha necatrix]|uniref:Uncharacterized protein n=1 Tax=Vairimorpha necatrix TaxID=6039 RepID=A0AAX4JF19_9MICR